MRTCTLLALSIGFAACVGRDAPDDSGPAAVGADATDGTTGDGDGSDGGDGVLGFIAFTLLPLRTTSGERIVQAQLLGYSLARRAPLEPTLLRLVAAALRHARRVGAHVFNAHALAELATGGRLDALGFGQGDATTSVCIDGIGGDGVALAPEAACWLPLL